MPSLLYTPAVTPARHRRRSRLPLAVAAALPLLLAGATPAALAKIPLIGDLLPAKPVVRKLGRTAPVVPGSMTEAQFLALLKSSDLQALNLGCREAVSFGFDQRVQLLQARLLTAAPAPQPLPVVLVNANALLTCLAPDGALAVLNRYGPQAREIIEKRLGFWVTLSVIVLVLGIIGALYLFLACAAVPHFCHGVPAVSG